MNNLPCFFCYNETMPIDERIDRTSFTVTTFDDADGDDIAYWMGKSPTERIEALEYLRRWAYGEAEVDARLQRIFTVAELGAD